MRTATSHWITKFLGLFLAGWLAWNFTAQAQAPRGPASNTARPAAAKRALELGEIDLKRSRVYIFVGKTGLGHEHGVEGKIKDGYVHVGSNQDVGEIEFDMTSFIADTEAARKYVGLEGSTPDSTRQQVNKNMLGKDVLNVAKYPTAVFSIASAVSKKNKKGQPIVELKGDFTLHGKTRPLTITAAVTEKKGMQNLRGEFTILQTDYGITPYSTALGAIGVADQLKIFGDLWIAAESSPQ